MNKDSTARHILVVDDEPLIHDILKSFIETCGFSVTIAVNGLEALRLMVEKEFDMVLMDIRMPIMDGLTATTFLRKCEQGEHLSFSEHHELAQSLHSRRGGTKTPVVAVTGNIGDREILIKAGMDEFITKPFNLETIHNVLDEFCGESAVRPRSYAMEDLPAERRIHPRYSIKNNTVTVCNGIAGQATDISFSGLAIRYAKHESIPNEWSVALFNTVKKISTPYLPLKLIRSIEEEGLPSSGVETKTIGAMFSNLDSNQKSHIRLFIDNLS